MIIIRRLNCIDAASGIVTLSKWPSAAQAEREMILILQVLLYQMVALFLYNFILMFLYWYTCFALKIFVLLTVHLSINLNNDHLDTPLLYFTVSSL